MSGFIDPALRELAAELRRDNDIQKKIADLKEQIQLTKSRIQKMLNSVDERITRLTTGSASLSKQNEDEILKQLEKAEKMGDSAAESIIKSASQISTQSTDSQNCDHFAERVTVLRSKLALLGQLEGELKTFRKESADDNKILKVAQEKMNEIEELRSQIVKKVEPYSVAEERLKSINTLTSSLSALDRLTELAGTTAEQKKNISNLSKDIRKFLQSIPDQSNVPTYEMDYSTNGSSINIPFTTFSNTEISSFSVNSLSSCSNDSASDINSPFKKASKEESDKKP